jgi:calcineurin-like phosphoesterase family protein
VYVADFHSVAESVNPAGKFIYWRIEKKQFPGAVLTLPPKTNCINTHTTFMPTTFFTADTHFGHANIIRYCNRPFDSPSHMDDVLIANWNSVVGPEDEVYHLGDFALCNLEPCERVLDRLNGKIYLIRGNHEKTACAVPHRFEWIKDYHELYVPDPSNKGGKQMIVMCHYAMRVWNASHHGAWQLYGHSHGVLADDPTLLSIDVGVDCHGYTPVSLRQVGALMAKKTWEPPFGRKD